MALCECVVFLKISWVFFLVLFSCLDWNVNVIMGVRASLTLVGREEKPRVKDISWACITKDLGVWAPLYVIYIHIFLWG